MNIEWQIVKKQGHLRPKLHYSIKLEPFEINLAVPMVTITSTIPKPPDAWQSHVYPGRNERKEWKPETFYELSTPSHKDENLKNVLTLPMREAPDYPEVESSFTLLRETYETALKNAYRNSAFEIRGEMGMSPETKRIVAPAVVAERLLNCFGSKSLSTG
ncbi:MAG: hypothetical protein PVG39_20720 [Desulfobacteraceae bacterium]|jgi:hypothetical protein